MAVTSRFSRACRRVFGLVAMLVASADVAAIAANTGNPTGAAAAAARLPMTAYGLLLLAVGLWCVVTSFATQKAVELDEVDDLLPVDGGDERAVIHALRDFGWYTVRTAVGDLREAAANEFVVDVPSPVSA